MSLIEVLILSFALGIDCLLVSFSQGLIFNTKKIQHAFSIAITMGVMHTIMTVTGYIGIKGFHQIINPYYHWATFIVFGALGIKYILDGILENNNNTKGLKKRHMLSICFITSIDAFFAGLSLNLSHTEMISSSIIIGFVAFLMSILGFNLGNKINNLPKKSLEFFAGIIFIFLAIKSIL